MDILNMIISQKLKEVEDNKSLYPVKLLEKSLYFEGPCVSLKEYVCDVNRSGIIAEFKRKSPSRGTINAYADAEKITLGYMQAGASALSVLTDETFFGAHPDDLKTARKVNYCPVLRKDFIIDEYQIIESKSMGADAVLLIAKVLDRVKTRKLTALAHSLSMEVLLETDSEKQITDNYNTNADLTGINNRNLNTFEVNLETSIRLAQLLPETSIKVAESGIQSADDIRLLKNNGFSGFLIGEYFMKHSNPGTQCMKLIKQLTHEN